MHGRYEKTLAEKMGWWNEVAKPYSSGHIGAVAATFTQMRMSGAVKDTLVELLVAELDKKVPEMEDATLDANPEKKNSRRCPTHSS